MAVSLELRVPFLDHPLVEFMANVPGRLKIKGRQKKAFLKRAFSTDLPEEILHRKKSGFSIPVARWLREDLRGLMNDYLGFDRLLRQGFFDPASVQSLRSEHDDLRRNNSSVLWSLLMFQLWMENYGRAG
jgi:asparagine synthase (glutamine-hydrolysing)